MSLLVDLITEAILNRPTTFNHDPWSHFTNHGYREKGAPWWYGAHKSLGHEYVTTEAAPLLVWLWQYVKPVLQELAADPKATQVLLDRLPPRAPFPRVRGLRIDTKARDEFIKTFRVPLVDLWVLWRCWTMISGLPEIPAPAYPGGKHPGSTSQESDGHESTFESWLRVVRWNNVFVAGCCAEAVEWVRDDLAELRRALPEAGPAPTHSDSPDAKKDRSLADSAPSMAALAIAVLTDHPDWTNKQIAAAVGCHVKTLSRWPLIRVARAAIREGKAGVARGSKSNKGNVEAWEPDEGHYGGNSLDAQYK
ncbi:MAG: hypothetical protein IMZ62_12030 [Chloroflexi bacterium]|nr:hypothetical protein [Chloroflexota bacterium]